MQDTVTEIGQDKMARYHYLGNNFTGGEVSPLVFLRTDFTRHKNGLRTLNNFVVIPQGGVTRRTGTRYVAPTKFADKEVELLNFEFNVEQTYAIEAGDLYFRFFTDNAQVREAGQDITDITQANPAVVTYSGADNYANGDRVFITGVEGMTQLNNLEFEVANVDTGANTFELLAVDSTGYGAYTSGGTVEEIYEVVSPYAHTDVSGIRFAQSNDILFLFHNDYPIKELRRFADNNWTIVDFEAIDGPYLREEPDTTILNLSDTSGTVTVTSNVDFFSATDTNGTGGTGNSERLLRIQDRDAGQTIANITQDNPARITYNGGDNYEAGDTIYISGVGGMTELNGNTYEIDRVTEASNYIFLKDTDSTNFTAFTSGGTVQKLRERWLYLVIKSYVSATEVTAEIQDDSLFGSTGPFTNVRLGAFSTTSGYPKAGIFYENRLVLGGTKGQKQTLWGSYQDDFNNFAPTDEDDGAWNFTLLSKTLDDIQWMSAQKQIRVGTAGSEFVVQGASSSSSITPTSVQVTRETPVGSSDIDAILIDSNTLYVQRFGKKLREFVYSFNEDSFVSPDLTLASEHVTRPQILDMAYQREPYGIVWMKRSDGTLLGLTYLKTQEVVAWHKHQIGGTDAKVEAITTIPGATQDQLWMVVEREVNGSTVKQVEYLTDRFVDMTVKEAIFVDSSLTFNGVIKPHSLSLGASTGSGVTFTASGSSFASTDVGREIRSGQGKAIITGYTSATVVTANIVRDFSSTGPIATGDWTLSTDMITGMNHLEGETIALLTDGGTHPDVVVTNGEVQLNDQYTDVTLGINYESLLESLDLEGTSSLGTTQGSRGRISEATLVVDETVGGELATNGGDLQEIQFRSTNDVQDEGIPLFTGKKIVRPSGSWQDSTTVRIRQTQPLPMTLLGYILKMETTDAP